MRWVLALVHWVYTFDSGFRTNLNICIFTAYSGIRFEFTRSFFSHHVAGLLIVKTWIIMA